MPDISLIMMTFVKRNQNFSQNMAVTNEHFLTKPRMEAPHTDLAGWQFADRFKSPSHLEHQTRLGLTHLGIKSHATENWETPTSWLPPPLSHTRVLLFVHIQPSEQWRPRPLCHLLSHLPLLTKAPKVITMKRKWVSITQVLTMFSKNKDKKLA